MRRPWRARRRRSGRSWSAPALRTELVGRDDLVDMVSAQLRQVRLITLIGPGGVGKTSVALAVGHRDRRRWAEAAVFVDLAVAGTGVDVLRALPTRSASDGDVSTIEQRAGADLSDQLLLIVFDNSSNVIDPAAELIDAMLGVDGPATF